MVTTELSLHLELEVTLEGTKSGEWRWCWMSSNLHSWMALNLWDWPLSWWESTPISSFSCQILFISTHPSIHPSIYHQPLIWGWVSEAAVSAGAPDFPFLGHINQLWMEDPKVFPGQCRDIISPPGSGPALGPLPSWTCLKHLPREATRRHPYQMPEPPQLASFSTKEQQLHSEFVTDD